MTTFRVAEMITQSRLKELFDYNEKTGEFTRIKGVRKSKVGVVAGTLALNGYIIISVDCRRYYAHRLAFLYMTGIIPDQVDHIDRDRSNNKWVNLRQATNSKNGANKIVSSAAVSAFKGVSFHKPRGRWRARIKVNNKEKHLGLFNDEHSAALAYDKAAKHYFGEYAVLNYG